MGDQNEGLSSQQAFKKEKLAKVAQWKGRLARLVASGVGVGPQSVPSPQANDALSNVSGQNYTAVADSGFSHPPLLRWGPSTFAFRVLSPCFLSCFHRH